jgi:sec-independent protein translocase protein TatC
MVKEDERVDLVTHLEELRTRLLRVMAYALVGMAALWFFFKPIYGFLIRPISEPLKHVGGELTVRGLMEGFLIKCEIALVGGIIIAAPLIYREVWAFVAPGLTGRERRVIRPLVPVSGVLFLMGVALAYLMTGPSVKWLLLYVPPEARALITLNDTLLLVLKFYLAFGLAFQLPIVLIVLAKMGIVESTMLSRRWREAVVVIFVIAAIITPTWDPITMTVCALPMVALYMGTLGVIKVMERYSRKAEEKAESDEG